MADTRRPDGEGEAALATGELPTWERAGAQPRSPQFPCHTLGFGKPRGLNERHDEQVRRAGPDSDVCEGW